MPHENPTLKRVESPSDEQLESSINLFDALMNRDNGLVSLCGGDSSKIKTLAKAMLRAGVHSGEYYEATTPSDGLVGFLMTMPSGQDLFSTEEQRALGLYDFMEGLSEAGKQYYKDVYLVEFPTFVNEQLGPTGRRDSWYIHVLMVKREFQGKGIGSGLLSLVRQKAAVNGDTVALSCTTDLNAEIYQKMGLELRGKKDMPSPWGDYPLYILTLETRV